MRDPRGPGRRLSLVLAMALALVASSPAVAFDAPSHSNAAGHFTVPGSMEVDDGAPLPYENGFLLVPENRAKPGSRLIAVRYLRFPAQTATPVPSPVVMLPGGPGSLIDEAALRSWPDTIRMIRHVTRSRDYVVLQQRGVHDSSYAAALDFPTVAAPLGQPLTPDQERQRVRDGLQAGLKHWSGLSVDLTGYAVHELVADIESLRTTLGVDTFVLYGTSFGSQWGMSYLKLHQQHVERAVLTGLEPLDYAYDSPDGIWLALQRIGDYAAKSDALSADLRGVRLTDVYKRVVERLAREPQQVQIQDPDSGQPVTVAVDAEDLRRVLYPVGGELRGNVEAWPKFLLELDRGDYRFLAHLAARNRRADPHNGLIELLIDNGLGISAKRQAVLDREPARRWLGDINSGYTYTRDLTPTPDVGDAFRADFDITVPTLLIQGDVDQSTPMENAISQVPYLKNGRLVIVEGGTHGVRKEILTPAYVPGNEAFGEAVLDFIAPVSSTPAKAQLAAMPKRIALAPFKFQSMQAPSLYDQARSKASR